MIFHPKIFRANLFTFRGYTTLTHRHRASLLRNSQFSNPSSNKDFFSWRPHLRCWLSFQTCHNYQTSTFSILPQPSVFSPSSFAFFLFGTARNMATAAPVAPPAAAPSHDAEIQDLLAQLKGFNLLDLPTSDYPGIYPEFNIVDVYRVHIAEIVYSILQKLELKENVTKDIVFQAVQRTNTLKNGDLLVHAARLRVKSVKPMDLAMKIAESFPESPLLHRPEATRDFVPLFFKGEPLAKFVIPSILTKQSSYGFNSKLGLKDESDPSKGRKRVIVEFSSPNIAKNFHAGHLRSTIIGGFLAHLYTNAGWDVIKMNYLGDWGKQYGLLGIGYELYGDAKLLDENPTDHLFDIYVKINGMVAEEAAKMTALKEEIATLEAEGKPADEQKKQLQDLMENGTDETARKYFKKMVDGDEEVLKTWRSFRELSIEKYKKTYARLNITYDVYSGESTVKEESMAHAAKVLEEKGISQESEGAVIVDLRSHNKKLDKAVVRKKDGTSLYLTRDIGAILERWEKYHFDKMFYIVGSQQDLHFRQLFKIVELMGHPEISSRCEHINFGMVKGMSTRKGTVKFLDDILKDVGDHMHEVMKSNEAKYNEVENPEKIADVLGISAVMVQDMTGKRINDYDFDLNRMCSVEGDTGPYLQYAHARLASIIRKAEIAHEELHKADLSVLTEPQAVNLIRALAQWPDIFIHTLQKLEPITVLTYLFDMTHLLSASYDKLRVLGSEEDVKLARLALYVSAKQVLSNGMKLLGLSPVERM